MDAARVGQNRFVVVTGGDDQHLCAWLFERVMTEKGQAEVTLLCTEKKYAHSSCVKGLVITKAATGEDSPASSNLFIHSSGYDQRFKTWAM